MHSQRHPDGALKISTQMAYGARTSSTRNRRLTDSRVEQLARVHYMYAMQIMLSRTGFLNTSVDEWGARNSLN